MPPPPLCTPCSDGSLSPAAAKVIFKELPEKSVYFVTGGTDAWQVRLLGMCWGWLGMVVANCEEHPLAEVWAAG